MAMNDDNEYTGKAIDEYQSVELAAFDEYIYKKKESRFQLLAEMTENPFPWFPEDWANTELIPFLQAGYGHRPEIGNNHDFWEDLRVAELTDPAEMSCYPVDQELFIERLRLAVIAPNTIPRPSRVASVADDMALTILLLIRRCVLNGPYKFGTLPPTVQPELAEAVELENEADRQVTKLVSQKK